jgi:hypothetical protein
MGRFPFDKKFWFEFLEMEQHFPEKRTTSRGIPKFLDISYRKFQFHLISLQEFPEFSVEWFAFRKFNNFRIFWRLSKAICVPFIPDTKFSEFSFAEWKAP